jgi:hypothetical protein
MPHAQVLNEKELVEFMRAFVASRGVPGEELVVFNHAEYPGFEATRDFFNHQVKAVIGKLNLCIALCLALSGLSRKASLPKGPHGGAFYNINFSPRDTLIVEFFPVRPFTKQAYRYPEGVWWQAACLQVLARHATPHERFACGTPFSYAFVSRSTSTT